MPKLKEKWMFLESLFQPSIFIGLDHVNFKLSVNFL